MTAPAIKYEDKTSTARCRVTVVRRWRSALGGTGEGGGAASPSRLGPQVRPQRLVPIGNGGNLLLAQQHLGVLLQARHEVGREARINLDLSQRLGKRLPRHGVALRREKRVDHVGDLAGIVLE